MNGRACLLRGRVDASGARAIACASLEADMRRTCLMLAASAALAALVTPEAAGAEEPASKPQVSVMTRANGPARPTLASYFAREDAGMQTGGVRRIPIHTPKGDF